jgi:hypothetical protein
VNGGSTYKAHLGGTGKGEEKINEFFAEELDKTNIEYDAGKKGTSVVIDTRSPT